MTGIARKDDLFVEVIRGGLALFLYIFGSVCFCSHSFVWIVDCLSLDINVTYLSLDTRGTTPNASHRQEGEGERNETQPGRR